MLKFISTFFDCLYEKKFKEEIGKFIIVTNLIYILVKNNCHPNPCENGGTCIDKYFYLDEGHGSNGASYDDTSEQISTGHIEANAFTANEALSEHNPLDTGIPNDMEPNDMSIEQHDKLRAIFKRESKDYNDSGKTLENEYYIQLGKHGNDKNLQERHVESLDLKDRNLLRHEKRDIDRTIFDDFINVEKSFNKYSRYANLRNKNNTNDRNFGELEYIVRNRREDEYLPSGINKNDLNFYGFACICPIRFKGQKCEGEY